LFALKLGDYKNRQQNNSVILIDGLAKKRNRRFSVIPAKAGIQEFHKVTNRLDTRFRGYGDYLRMHLN
jgi:hypothetical protein